VNVESLIGLLNFISRWILFLTVAYKTIKTKEKSWALLTFAFFVNALDVETYILTPLGIQIKYEAYEIASMVPNFLIALLIIWGAIHLRIGRTKLKHVIRLGIYVSFAYIWLFFAATSSFDNLPFAIRRMPSSVALGGSLMYLGITLRKYVVRKHTIEELFPSGLILLGALNLTYPFTRNIEWFANMAFFSAAVFRLMAAIGAFKFVFYPVSEPKHKVKGKISGIYIFPNESKVRETFSNLFTENNVIVITRKDPRIFSMENDMLIYWITKIKEGMISDNPRIFAISPTKIDILIDLITKGLKQGYNVVYLDAFEYLMLENGFESAFKFLLSLKDRVMAENGTLIFVVSLDALSEKQRKLIEREFTKYE